MQCMMCQQGSFLTTDLEEIKKNGSFFRQIVSTTGDPAKKHYFFICPICREGCRELVKELVKELKETKEI